MTSQGRNHPDFICKEDFRSDEKFIYNLPRSMEGEGLSIVRREGDGLVITDGKRTALYVPCRGKPLSGNLKIENEYTEAGWFMEAGVVHIGNGKRTKPYQPSEVILKTNKRLTARPRTQIEAEKGD